MARKGSASKFKYPSYTKEQILAVTHLARVAAAEHLGISVGTLSRYCTYHGINFSSFYRELAGDDITKKEMLACDGMTSFEARKHLNVSKTVLYKLIKWYKMEGFLKGSHKVK